ncbi:MAG TPA: hypothetical protein DD001_00520 [Microcoleaceae bacterium UBA10368]|nr:hypothetical protein [Microcoleaceae cyanobacterium UBA10368]HCV30887.1 hypothetical protein [Microcoleaceae cyanobacterium UBA9251]
MLLVRGYWLAVNVASTSQFCWRRGGFATVAGWRERSHPPTRTLDSCAIYFTLFAVILGGAELDKG